MAERGPRPSEATTQCQTVDGWLQLTAGDDSLCPGQLRRWLDASQQLLNERAEVGSENADLGLAACTFVPLYPSAARQLERFRVFCDAYGLNAEDRVELLDVAVERIRRMWHVLVDNADREPYATLVRDGHAEFWRVVEGYVRDQTCTWREMLGA